MCLCRKSVRVVAWPKGYLCCWTRRKHLDKLDRLALGSVAGSRCKGMAVEEKKGEKDEKEGKNRKSSKQTIQAPWQDGDARRCRVVMQLRQTEVAAWGQNVVQKERGATREVAGSSGQRRRRRGGGPRCCQPLAAIGSP